MKENAEVKKVQLMDQCLEVMKKRHVETWYNKNLKGKNQYYTIQQLEKAIKNNALSVREALFIAWLVGLQWHEKFECE